MCGGMSDYVIELAKGIKKHYPDFDVNGVINIVETSKNDNEAVMRYSNYVTDYICKHFDKKDSKSFPIVPSYMIASR